MSYQRLSYVAMVCVAACFLMILRTNICCVEPQNAPYTICSLEVHIVYPAYTICSPLNREHIVYDMYHTYTICSLAEERSRGGVLDPISMGCGFEPHLKHCVVFLNMTLDILCSVLVSPPPPPMKSEGYCFGVGRLCTRLSGCPPVLPETYLSTY